jgi:periplasmic protein TonB
MPKNLRFWINVGLIAIAHVAVIVGLIRWSRASNDANAQSIVWMNGGAGDGVVTEKKSPAPSNPLLPRKESKIYPLKERDLDDDRPVLASAPSEIQLPAPTASPVLDPTPLRSPKPSPTPKIKGTPKSNPRPRPKPTPKPSPKKLTLAKASPKLAPLAKPTPEKTKEDKADIESERIARAVPEKDDSGEQESKKSEATVTGMGKGAPSGAGGGRTGGSASAGQFSWYGSMLHDRFYSEWVQPATVASAGTKNSVLVKLRIERDGRVSSFEVVRPSGNSELDESVKALASRVTQVEPLPDGLGKGDHYDVHINFELNSE